MRILVVEDDRLLNNTLCYNLDTAGYAVDSALTKSAASNFLTKQDYDLIVLDVNLPDGNGFDFCREVKERRPDTAVIFLTANDMESDMLKGYELGAEDYVTKPFPMSVFQKKLSVVLGRLAKQSGGDCYEDGALSINFSEMTASLSGKPLVFTPLEYRLLKILTKNPQNVLTKDGAKYCYSVRSTALSALPAIPSASGRIYSLRATRQRPGASLSLRNIWRRNRRRGCSPAIPP